MKIADIRNLPDDEIDAEIGKARQLIFKTRFRGVGSDVENPGSLKELKKNIARLLTVQNERASRLVKDREQGANRG